MKNQYAKLFLEVVSENITYVPYSPGGEEYYRIVKQERSKGCRQIIVTSDMMISILEKYFYERHFEVVSIEFMEQDDYVNEDIDKILENLKEDRAYLGVLIKKINFLAEESAIDIRRIEMKGRNKLNKAIQIGLQVNGVYSITDQLFKEESEILVEIIKEELLK